MNERGLDISVAQGNNVDFQALKSAGCTFVILRAGYGSALKYPNQFDPTFDRNYKEAKKVGLKVGAYWYTYATTTAGIQEEARAFCYALKGKQFELPVYMDIEERSQFNANTTKLVIAFCDYMEHAGYFAGVYCSTFWYTNYVKKETRERYACWIADWSSKCSYTGTYGIWQRGTTKIYNSGTGDIDDDVLYIDYTSIIKKKGLNGFAKQTPKEETVTVSYKIKKRYKETLDNIAKKYM